MNIHDRRRPRRARLLPAGLFLLALTTGCGSTLSGAAMAVEQAQRAHVSTPAGTSAPTEPSPPPAPAEPSAPAEGTEGSASSEPPTSSGPTGTAESSDPPSPSESPTTSAADVELIDPSDVEIHGSNDGSTDFLVRYAIADVTNYWRTHVQEVYGGPLTELRGGYWSIDPDAPDAKLPAGCLGDDPKRLKNNAVYCGKADAIVFDRLYLNEIAEQYSELDVALAVAHEFSHALQARFEKARAKTIVRETQADCLAGAWLRPVIDGTGSHFSTDASNLDRILVEFVLVLGDTAGSDPDDDWAHGSAFDRITAMQEGFLDGPHSCVNNFSNERVFTSEKFTEENASTDGKGNVTYEVAVEQGVHMLNDFWSTTLDGQATFVPPTVTIDPADVAGCEQPFALRACAATGVLLVDEKKLRAQHTKIGDFATVTALAMTYAEYLQQTVLSGTDARARLCTVGAFAASMMLNEKILSPGDFDEAIYLLLVLTTENTLVDVGNTSAWDRMDAFRLGAFQGLDGCSIQLAGP